MTPPPPPAAAAAAAPAIHPRRTPPAPVRRPRRVSGPAARPAPARGRTKAASTPAIAVTTRTLLERLIHGRAWIGIVAFALIGIVTMQLGLLKLNAGIGRALEHEAALQRENSALSVENSEYSAGDTVELQAAHMGMQLVPAGALRFLSGPGSATNQIARAVAALNARASGASATTATEASPSTESEASATSTSVTGSTESTTSAMTSTGAGEAAESTSTSGTSASGTSTSGTTASSAGGPAASAGATSESGASAPTSTAAPTGESGGASASPQG
jgi:hypothetical protein